MYEYIPTFCQTRWLILVKVLCIVIRPLGLRSLFNQTHCHSYPYPKWENIGIILTRLRRVVVTYPLVWHEGLGFEFRTMHGFFKYFWFSLSKTANWFEAAFELLEGKSNPWDIYRGIIWLTTYLWVWVWTRNSLAGLVDT